MTAPNLTRLQRETLDELRRISADMPRHAERWVKASWFDSAAALRALERLGLVESDTTEGLCGSPGILRFRPVDQPALF
jgi:hypothetical protein